jgi:signal peptidase I
MDTNEQKQEHPFIEILRFAIIALVIVLPIRIFIAQPFIVSGASMEDTFHNNEYLIVDQLTYRFHEPARGDVIVFRYPRDPSKFFIKRVIGLPGDTVTINGNAVTIANDAHPDGIVLDEPYLNTPTDSYLSETLSEGEYFVMGDNRGASSDSRVWGTLPKDNIVGRALLRLFPVAEASVLPGAYDLNDELRE